MSESADKPVRNGKIRVRFGAALTLVGFLLFLLGANPGLFNQDRSAIIGFVQIAVFLFGLGMICMGGFIGLQALWNGRRKSIAAEIGLRLAGTGFVIAVVAGMADVIGLGTRPLPYVPFFGYWQARGVLIGEIVIVIGFALMIPLARRDS